MRDTKEALENVSTSLETLQEATTKLRRSLQLERSSLSNTLNDPACGSGNATRTCNNIRAALNQLAVGANFNGVKHTYTSFMFHFPSLWRCKIKPDMNEASFSTFLFIQLLFNLITYILVWIVMDPWWLRLTLNIMCHFN